VRDESAARHSIQFYPGDRRHFKTGDAEEWGDFMERQSLVQPLEGS
jgi:hypothetical protein